MKGAEELLREYISHLRVEKGLSKNTTSAYERDIQKFIRFLDETKISVDSTTHQEMQEFVSRLRGKGGKTSLAESSIFRTVVAIRNFYQFASKEEGFLNPIKDFLPPKITKRLPKALTISQIESLVSASYSEDNPISFRDRALIELLYATGGRISEIVSLTLADLNKLGESQNLSIKLQGKGGKERIVPVGRYAQEAVEQYLVRTRPTLQKGKRSDVLFLNASGTQLSRQSGWSIISKAATRAGISSSVTPHSMRHSFATHLLDGGADIRVVQELLGHSSVTTTQIYTLVTIDKVRESYSQAHPRAK